jgi:hypothetical protein
VSIEWNYRGRERRTVRAVSGVKKVEIERWCDNVPRIVGLLNFGYDVVAFGTSLVRYW